MESGPSAFEGDLNANKREKDEGFEGGEAKGGWGVIASVAFLFAAIPVFWWGLIFGTIFIYMTVTGEDPRVAAGISAGGTIVMFATGYHQLRRVRSGKRFSIVQANYDARDYASDIKTRAQAYF
jgi:hypothetical protein